jgi:alpha-galactosidase
LRSQIVDSKTSNNSATHNLHILSAKLLTFCAVYFFLLTAATATQLSNRFVTIELNASPHGIPVISQVTWTQTGNTIFSDDGSIQEMQRWIPEELVKEDSQPTKWTVRKGRIFTTAEASRDLLNGLKMTWVVALFNQGTLMRLSVRLTNTGNYDQNVDWFPTWVASWNFPEQIDALRWWDALTYKPQETKDDGKYRLGSRLHSSDILEDGVYPYWVVKTAGKQFYFGLEWCGGWEAKLNKDSANLSFAVRLPGDETQLVLHQGETIDGPVLSVTPTMEMDEATNRLEWMMERQKIARSLYRRSVINFPLNYNPWFAIGFDVDSKFLHQQIDAMSPYQFDNFIFDAGWYEAVGKWEPSAAKFLPGEFEDMIARIKEQGTKVGLWSCPQYITVDGDMPPQVDDPNHFESFIDGFLLDLADTNYQKILSDHVGMLKSRYEIDWWKYDQPLFVPQSRAGAMKNVIAFQDALKNVSRTNPTLTIEGCLNGGRMINELTALTSNTLWLRDGQSNRLALMRRNIEVNLGALEFLFPWQAYTWTNNVNELEDNQELLKYYCRTAMIGTWGISADLSKISSDQQQIILTEIQRYRTLNEIKSAFTYDIQNPVSGDDIASVIYYDETQQRSGALVYRWDGEGAMSPRLLFRRLIPDALYLVRDVDRGKKARLTGKELMEDGYTVKFSEDRLSALVFAEQVQ